MSTGHSLTLRRSGLCRRSLPGRPLRARRRSHSPPDENREFGRAGGPLRGKLAAMMKLGQYRCMRNQLRMKTVGVRKTQAVDVWDAVRQLTETAEQIRGSRALVPRGVHRFTTFE